MKENTAIAVPREPTARITRARAAAVHAAFGENLIRLPLGKPEQQRVPRGNSKRAALDENSIAVTANVALQPKRRAVLKDVSNVYCDSSYKNCINATKLQMKKLQRAKLGTTKAKLANARKSTELAPAASVRNASVPAASVGNASVREDEKGKLNEEMQNSGTNKFQENTVSANLEVHSIVQQIVEEIRDKENASESAFSGSQHSGVVSELLCPARSVSEDWRSTCDCKYIDIDSDQKNPQMCSLYATDIYDIQHVEELIQRPNSNFMETIQHDITQSMRAILVDWLVEVAEEYKLVPDTLYLTVHFIDRFLSENFIERQKLQLLGITCMLIASKYEEICAPRVEEFCFITDNTYTRSDVLEMELQIVKYLEFRLSVPTVKTFLRRFLRAAQASYEVPSLVLEFLTNYLAELTLIEYKFLKFRPSMIAASAVFLARWTLDQSDNPWNPTLEHYTSYKASDLKTTILSIQSLQKNSKSCPLRAIREKYRQIKFKSVSDLPPQELLPTAFL